VDLIGGWFGTGADRGIALVFTVTGIIGLCVTLFAMSTKHYRLLSNEYMAGMETMDESALVSHLSSSAS
jgi:DHA3 family multidrug efflux protein-like MFS transporter